MKIPSYQPGSFDGYFSNAGIHSGVTICEFPRLAIRYALVPLSAKSRPAEVAQIFLTHNKNINVGPNLRGNMGYLITGMFLLERPSQAALRVALPASVEFRIYEHPELQIYAIGGFRQTKPSAYPLSMPFSTADVPLELGPHLSLHLGEYQKLQELGVADGFKRAYMNLAEIVSAALGKAVLTLFTDDDGIDFACIAQSGRVSLLWAQCGTDVLKIDGASVAWLPLGELPLLHQNAALAFRQFTGKDPQMFGFGSWDPPHNFGLLQISG